MIIHLVPCSTLIFSPGNTGLLLIVSLLAGAGGGLEGKYYPAVLLRQLERNFLQNIMLVSSTHVLIDNHICNYS